MPTPGEHKTVQARILAYAEAIGWTFVSQKRERDLILIDYEHPERNVYEVTEELAYHNGHYGTRQDVVFLTSRVLFCQSATQSIFLRHNRVFLSRSRRDRDKSPLLLSHNQFSRRILSSCPRRFQNGN